ncbi:glycosyltransferase family 2 protein [Clostridium perfringens]|nr:glycosyltransferase family 2 protein [Clostridium perfringens]
MELEVLVATMNQKDLSKYKQMNLQTNAIFANQSNTFNLNVENIDGNIVKLITMNERGVGKNRNIALMHATADILLMADDDLVYYDNYENIVIEAFKKLKDADIIIFNIDDESEDEKRRYNSKIKRIRQYNCLNYGTPRMAIKRNSQRKSNIWFSLLYGGGSEYSCGEDSLFLLEALRKGLKIYTFPISISKLKKNDSTWFKGYNKRFYFDKGVWISNAFPKSKWLLVWYFALRFKQLDNENNFLKILKFLINGIKFYKKGEN